MVRNWLRAILAAALLLVSVGVAQSAEELENPDPEDWPTLGRTLDMQRYSPLDQIDADNVGQLRVVWTRDLDVRGRQQAAPVVYDGVMYINGIDSEVLALDAATGELLWRYDAALDENFTGSPQLRGSVVVYDGKVFYARRDASVVALDAATGEELWHSSVGNVAWNELFSSGPIFADGKIIVGPAGADAGGNPGRILALNPEDGEILWTFNIIPGPEDAEAYATWNTPPDPERGIGGGSAWTPGAYDPVTRTVIYGTGQPNPWDRIDERRGQDEGAPSADLYTASWVALDVDTGELKWYHQVIPGDEWDGDMHPTPVIADVEIGGEPRRVAILATTTGYVVILDVATGEYIDSIQYHEDPQLHLGYEEDGTPIINDDLRITEDGGTVSICGRRSTTYNSAAYSPQTGLYYRAHTNDCYNYTLYTLPDDWERGQSATNFELQFLPDTFDALSALTAFDPRTGEIVWQYEHGYRHWGGGALATAGGLVFSAFPDRTFRAFDAATGEVLWEQVLHAGMESDPITYAVDGVQYVAQIAGTSGTQPHQEGLPDTITGSSVVWVFALPPE
ncbi:MAG TPA: PQQ-binding-like beta-propeller repeat protein [Trueperaceae bacterium]|jgi:alcohol dehydrogenase (cytochrome c)